MFEGRGMKASSSILPVALLLFLASAAAGQGSGGACRHCMEPNCTPPGMAQGEPGEVPFGDPEIVLAMIRSIHLTDDQLDRVDQVMADRGAQIADAMERAGITEPGRDFLAMFTSPDLSVRDLSGFMDRLDQLKTEVEEIDLSTIVSLHDILTPGQLAELSAIGTPCPFEGSGRDRGDRTGERDFSRGDDSEGTCGCGRCPDHGEEDHR